MSGKSKYWTIFTCLLAYFSNCFIYFLPFLPNEILIKDLTVGNSSFSNSNLLIILCQNFGIFLGAVLFGNLADKKGRLLVLFSSIFVYGLGTLLGGLVDNFYVYLFLRFIVGLGLAPEIGIGLVLIIETYQGNKRSFLVFLIGIFGFIGVFSATLFSRYFEWRDIYTYSGLFSIFLMLLRFTSYESDIYVKIKSEIDKKSIKIGSNIRDKNFGFLLLCLLPIYVIASNSTFKLAFGNDVLNLKINPFLVGLWYSLGALVGLVFVTVLVRILKSRLRAIQVCLLIIFINSSYLFLGYLKFSIFTFSANIVTAILFVYGLSAGYLFEFFIFSSEFFGTDKRAGSISLLFSFGRSSILLFSFIIIYFNSSFIANYAVSIYLVEVVSVLLALLASFKLKENYNRDLDFVS